MAEEGVVGGDEPQRERKPLVQRKPPIYLHFRDGREQQQPSRCKEFILTIFKIAFCSLGLWGHRAWNYIPRVLFVIICALQAAYQLSVDFKCPYFNCKFDQKFNQTPLKYFLETKETCFTLYSLAAAISYLVFIGCFFVSRRKDSVMMSPSMSMMEDVDKTEIFVLFLAFIIIVASFSSAMVLFFSYQLHIHFICGNSELRHVYIIATAVVILLANWASVNTCHVFAINSLTLGTFAQDTFRLIREVQNGTLDDVIKIHEDLCTVVLNTVSAYSVWFVLHWFTYGAGVVVDIILISEELLDNNKTPTVFKVYICCLLVCFLYVFTLPCFCAARITSSCAGVYEKINCTTSEDWPVGHPFRRDRHNIALFISYAKDRRCGFKVGRITFNTSLAWLSFFFGLTALLFHFF